jgi:hypothetical protein
MLAPRSAAFPFEAVRDLLGIVRAMYAAYEKQSGAAQRLDALRRIGCELRQATELALEHEVGSLGHAAAWQRAERATRRLGELVDCTTPLEPTLVAAVRRLNRATAPRKSVGKSRRAPG